MQHLEINNEDFKDAADIARRKPAGKGCESIPYGDLQRACKTSATARVRNCKGSKQPESCKELRNPLTQAKAKKNSTEVKKIRTECLKRMEHAKSCAEIRTSIQLQFKRSKGRVARDKRTFQSKKSSGENRYNEETL